MLFRSGCAVCCVPLQQRGKLLRRSGVSGLRRLGHTLKALPNPSVEARPNGRPPGPVWWYGYIFTSPGLASCRRSRLTSNVRHQTNSLLPLQQEVRLSACIEQPRGGQAANPVRRRTLARSNQTTGRNRPIKQPDFSQGRRELRPVQAHEDAAGGGEMGSATSLRQVRQRG